MNKILMLLKMRGPLTGLEIAQELKITKEGVRQQVLKLTEEGLIEVKDESKGVGRPQKTFSVSELGNAKFPDTHAELTVKLIGILRHSVGENTLADVISIFEQTGKKRYTEEISPILNLEDKIVKLVEIRTREGYMAEYIKNEVGFLFIENHCPICAAATVCQGFCSSELNVFRSVLGSKVTINRVNHIIAGERRCSYQITIV